MQSTKLQQADTGFRARCRIVLVTTEAHPHNRFATRSHQRGGAEPQPNIRSSTHMNLC
jgi:hypothetical protein